MTDPYPEHTKLRKVKDQTQLVGEFIEWLYGEGYAIVNTQPGRSYTEATNSFLSRFFEIDEDKLEEEKRRMLEEIRNNG